MQCKSCGISNHLNVGCRECVPMKIDPNRICSHCRICCLDTSRIITTSRFFMLRCANCLDSLYSQYNIRLVSMVQGLNYANTAANA